MPHNIIHTFISHNSPHIPVMVVSFRLVVELVQLFFNCGGFFVIKSHFMVHYLFLTRFNFQKGSNFTKLNLFVINFCYLYITSNLNYGFFYFPFNHSIILQTLANKNMLNVHFTVSTKA